MYQDDVVEVRWDDSNVIERMTLSEVLANLRVGWGYDEWTMKPLDTEDGPDGPRERGRVWATCGTCGRTWDDDHITGTTPAPSGRCPFEYDHEDDES